MVSCLIFYLFYCCSIFSEERLRRLTVGIDLLKFCPSENFPEDDTNETSDSGENKDSSSDASIFSSVSPGRFLNNHFEQKTHTKPEGICTSGKELEIASQNDGSPSFLEMRLPCSVMSLLRYYQIEKFESSSRFISVLLHSSLL